jgi:hypothetical protein
MSGSPVKDAFEREVQAAQFYYTDNGDRTCTITGYTGPGGAVHIPDSINLLTVVGIGDAAFFQYDTLTSSPFPPASPASESMRLNIAAA